MTDGTPTADQLADEVLLDRLGARTGAGLEPVAGLLSALATVADAPIGPARSAPTRSVRPRSLDGQRRGPRRRRSVAAVGMLTVALSGAGVAAAMTVPDLAREPRAPVTTSRPAVAVTSVLPQHAGTARGAAVTPTNVPATGKRVTSTSPASTTGTPAPGAPTAPSSGLAAIPGHGRGATPPTPARDGRPPGLVSGPGTPAATVPSVAGRGQQRAASGIPSGSARWPERTATSQR